jgi:UDP-2,3-diacylglucosamine pyrophosphatase LpxH
MGVTIRYTPGNHDEFFRGFLSDFGLFQVADQFLYRRVDGRRYVITHGDQFETHASHSRWQSVVGGFGYDCLLWSNHIWNRGRGWVGRDAVQFSAKIKMGMRTVLRALDAFEQRISEYAQTLHCDGVVCGHVHVPRINFHDSINYCNTGDWVENCSALIEDLDGTFRIEHYNPETMAGETGQPVCVNATPPAPGCLRAMPVPFGRGFRTADQEPSPAGAEWRVAAGRDASDDREAGLVGSAARSRSSV